MVEEISKKIYYYIVVDHEKPHMNFYIFIFNIFYLLLYLIFFQYFLQFLLIEI